MDEQVIPLEWAYDLYLLGRIVSSHSNPQQVQGIILDHIVRGMRADNGSLAIRSEDQSGVFTIVAGVHLPPGVVGSQIRQGEGVMGWVAQTGEALLLNGDLSTDARFSGFPQKSVSCPASAMCWPLLVDDSIIGVLSVNRLEASNPYREEDLERGKAMISLVAVVIENTQLHLDQQRKIRELSRVNQELADTNKRLEEAQGQLLQSEKMASVGQLAAGVAHEINNPIGYVGSNLATLNTYLSDVLALLDAYRQTEALLPGDSEIVKRIRQIQEGADVDFLREDIVSLLQECDEGITRVKKIVQDLKDFSHADAVDVWQWADMRKGLDSTLNIVRNELKYKAKVVKEYAEIPDIECIPSQLNQVFMNMLVNAGHAIVEQGVITVRTGAEAGQVWVEIADTGGGIAPEHLQRIFDPFFTTKPVGKGTGLGLSLSYGIVQKHHGRIEVRSELGKGTVFRIWLPVQRPDTVTE